MRTRRYIALCVLLTGTFLTGVQSLSAQQAKVLSEGADDYTRYCAACHGSEGHGDGEMASILVKPPSDLMRITERFEEFPFWRVYAIIAGDEPVPGHDAFQMPQVRARMKADEAKPGYLPAHVRVLLLTHYIESLQSQ